MFTHFVRVCHAIALASALILAYGCALESAPTIDAPEMGAEAACGSCPLGYTAVSQGTTQGSGSCTSYTCSCNGDWAVACGTPDGSCTSCAPGKTCTSAGSCLDSCLRGGHEAGSACSSGGYPGKWGASSSGCVCCTGCFDPHTGLCTQLPGAWNDDANCGAGGAWCDTCGYGFDCFGGSCEKVYP